MRCTATGDLCRDASSALRLAEFVAVVSSISPHDRWLRHPPRLPRVGGAASSNGSAYVTSHLPTAARRQHEQDAGRHAACLTGSAGIPGPPRVAAAAADGWARVHKPSSTIALTMSSSAHEIMRRLTEPFEG